MLSRTFSGYIRHRSIDKEMYILYTQLTMKNVISATKARNNFFEMLNSVIYKGEEFIVEKDGKPAVRVSSAVSKRDPKEIDKVLKDVRRVFAKSAKRKYWSVIDTPAWKRKEARYLKRLSEGIID